MTVDLMAALKKSLEFAKEQRTEQWWALLSPDDRAKVIDKAQDLRPRTIAVVGNYRSYEHWRRTKRVDAVNGDLHSLQMLSREFYCSRVDRLRAVQLERVVTLYGFPGCWSSRDLEELSYRIEQAKASGTWHDA